MRATRSTVEALLICELDGPEVEVDHLIDRVRTLAEANGATSVRASESEAERLLFWSGRKAAFPAVGRISPDYFCMDGTIPRHRLAEVLSALRGMSQTYGLDLANVFHAGDGNLHPLILFDANTPGDLEKAESFGADILRKCVAVGGVLTGEHGVGVEKRDLMGAMFSETDMAQQQRLKCAFDPRSPAQPRQGVPDLAPLRRTGAAARDRRPTPVPRPAEVLMAEVLHPGDELQVAEVIRWALAGQASLAIRGQGSKARLGHAVAAAHGLDVSALSGMVDYAPTELVFTAKAATPLAEIAAALAENNQRLAFEPPDYGPLWGDAPGRGTLGGGGGLRIVGAGPPERRRLPRPCARRAGGDRARPRRSSPAAR